MSTQKKQQRDGVPSWIEKSLKILSSGRYYADWWPEILEEYNNRLDSDGENSALTWLYEELLHSFQPGAVGRILWILRLAYRAYQFYQSVTGG
jgi:hypothetical protein